MSDDENYRDVSSDGMREVEVGDVIDGDNRPLKRPYRRIPGGVFNMFREIQSVIAANTLDEDGKGVVGSPTISDRIRGVPHEFDFDLYEALYKTEALVFRGVNITANHVMQPGFTIEGGNEENRTLIEDWSSYIGLDILFHGIIKTLLVFGNAYFEIIKSNNDDDFKSLDLKPIPSNTMYVYRTETGDVIGYIQVPKTRRFYRGRGAYLSTRRRLQLPSVRDKSELYTEKKRGWKGQVREAHAGAVPFDANEIIHIKNNEMSGGEYGLSVIEPMMASLTIYQGMRLDISVISRRYAAPKILWLVGDETQPATDEMIDGFLSRANASNIGDDFVVPSWISFSVIGAGEVAMDMTSYIQMLRDDVFAGLSVPEVLMGGTIKGTLASAKIQLESFSRRIVVLQRILSHLCRRVIFPLVLHIDDDDMTREAWKNIPEVVFRPMITEEERMLRAMNLYKENVISREEARRLLGLPDEPDGHMKVEDEKEIAKVTSQFGGSRGPPQSTGGGGDDKSKAEKPSGERPKDQGGGVGQ